MIIYAIESRRIGSTKWGTIEPNIKLPDQYQGKAALGFETREEAQAYIDANMPRGWEAQIIELTVNPETKH
jgi:hypothetical protein